MARLVVISALILVAMGALASGSRSVYGQEWLVDGGFESGGDAWLTTGGAPATCQPHEGDGALGVSVSGAGDDDGRLSHQMEGPLPAATYTFSGWTRLQSGSGTVRVVLSLVAPGDTPRGISVPEAIVSGSSYTHFSVSTTVGFQPESAVIALSVDKSAPAVLCIDSLTLTTPDSPPSPTPPPTATASPTATATANPSPSATPATPGISPTPVATAAPTRTGTPTKTATPLASTVSGPTFAFANGGFEQGLSGWAKYGGSLTTTGGARTGAAAGLLTSTTDSTKWAYQPVAIDPGQFYEFAGHLQPDAGVGDSYLRISWYASPTAEGSALSTTDSTQRVAGGATGYAFVTTGAVQPPPGTASARVRIILAPLGAGIASVRLDDISFGPAAPPTSTPTPTADATATATQTPTDAPTPWVPLLGAIAGPSPVEASAATATTEAGSERSSASAGAMAAPRSTASSAAGPTSEVAAVRSEPAPPAGTTLPVTTPRATPPPEPSRDALWPWIAGIGLLIVGLAGAYFQNRTPAH